MFSCLGAAGVSKSLSIQQQRPADIDRVSIKLLVRPNQQKDDLQSDGTLIVNAMAIF